MARFTDEELKKKVHEGYIVESEEDMTEGYRKALINQLTVQADTELMSAPSYWMAARYAPSTNTQVSAHAIIQDELAHANIAYRLLEDLGRRRSSSCTGVSRTSSSTPTGSTSRSTTGPSWSWPTASSTGPASRCSSDVYQNTSYGPLKRALVKVGMEETFHLRHGEVWMRAVRSGRRSPGDGAARRGLDVPDDVEWFGLPDDRKRHSGQLDYKLKGLTNDQLRQVWMERSSRSVSRWGSTCRPTAIRTPAKSSWTTDFPASTTRTTGYGCTTSRSPGTRYGSAGARADR